jgi:DNA methylase
MSVDEIQFVKELYPRLREDSAAIERYRAAIDKLPPIVVARGRVLVDGFHRWRAHKDEKLTEIQVEDLGNLTDTEIFNESIRRNAQHGQQLTKDDKQRLCAVKWGQLGHLDEGDRVKEIMELLAVGKQFVYDHTKDVRAAEEAALRDRVWDLHLDCWSQPAIAKEVDRSQKTVSNWVSKISANGDFTNPPDSRQHFDVWNFTMPKEDESSYFGKMPPQVVENLLWLYTEPGQTVFDPFAGGGTTIDVAKTMGRRVWASDRKPSTPLLPIHEHDITNGWPDGAPKKADFILLDPPYWKQAANRYSDDPADLGNMSLDDFYGAWAKTVKVCADHLNGGLLAFIVSPAEDKENDHVEDLALGMYRLAAEIGLQPRRRIIVTYNTQQATGQQVEWARREKKLLKLYRDLVVMGF